MTIGERIKALRIKQGLTQRQLGEMCDPPIHEVQLRKYERGEVTPKMQNACRIANALKVPVSELLALLAIRYILIEILNPLGMKLFMFPMVAIQSVPQTVKEPYSPANSSGHLKRPLLILLIIRYGNRTIENKKITAPVLEHRSGCEYHRGKAHNDTHTMLLYHLPL